MSVCWKCWTVLGEVADQQRYNDNQKKLCVHLNNAELRLRVRRRLCQTDHLGRRSQGTNGSLLAWKNPRKHHQLCTTQVINYTLAKIGTKIWSSFVFEFSKYFLGANKLPLAGASFQSLSMVLKQQKDSGLFSTHSSSLITFVLYADPEGFLCLWSHLFFITAHVIWPQ